MRVTGASNDIRTLFGGLPFVHQTFAPKALLAAVTARRLLLAGERQPSPEAIARELEPTYAARQRVVPPEAVINSTEPTAVEKDAVTEALAHLAQAVLWWGPLLEIPWVVRKIQRPGVISASSMGYPQHLFFADEAFASPSELLAQVLHESSHSWMYMIEELWPLSTTSGRDLTLPSGTAGRNASEILGATHVVTNLLRLAAASGQGSRQKIQSLRQYRASCLDLLHGEQSRLTPQGMEVAWLLTTVQA